MIPQLESGSLPGQTAGLSEIGIGNGGTGQRPTVTNRKELAKALTGKGLAADEVRQQSCSTQGVGCLQARE